MTEIIVPCEKIARLANILQYFPVEDEWAKSFRLDGNCIVATNRNYLAVERLNVTVDKPIHIKADESFIDQCRAETVYNSNVHFIANDILGMVTARTTLGYQHPGNLLHNPGGVNEMDRWRSIVPSQPASVTNIAMMLDTTHLRMFAETSPSGKIVFEQHVDIQQPSIVRDLIDPDWFGVMWCKDSKTPHVPATLPGWFK